MSCISLTLYTLMSIWGKCFFIKIPVTQTYILGATSQAPSQCHLCRDLYSHVHQLPMPVTTSKSKLPPRLISPLPIQTCRYHSATGVHTRVILWVCIKKRSSLCTLDLLTPPPGLLSIWVFLLVTMSTEQSTAEPAQLSSRWQHTDVLDSLLPSLSCRQ